MRKWGSKIPSDLPKSLNELVTKPKPYFSVFLFLSLMSYLLGQEFLKSASRSPRTGNHLLSSPHIHTICTFSQSNSTFSWYTYFTIILHLGWEWGRKERVYCCFYNFGGKKLHYLNTNFRGNPFNSQWVLQLYYLDTSIERPCVLKISQNEGQSWQRNLTFGHLSDSKLLLKLSTYRSPEFLSASLPLHLLTMPCWLIRLIGPQFNTNHLTLIINYFRQWESLL